MGSLAASLFKPFQAPAGESDFYNSAFEMKTENSFAPQASSWSLNGINLLGFFTRDGRRDWKNLQYLEYKSVQTVIHGHFLLRILLRILRGFMFADVQKIQVEMVFADKTAPAVLPPLIANQRQILELINTIPVERRGEEQLYR